GTSGAFAAGFAAWGFFHLWHQAQNIANNGATVPQVGSSGLTATSAVTNAAQAAHELAETTRWGTRGGRLARALTWMRRPARGNVAIGVVSGVGETGACGRTRCRKGCAPASWRW